MTVLFYTREWKAPLNSDALLFKGEVFLRVEVEKYEDGYILYRRSRHKSAKIKGSRRFEKVTVSKKDAFREMLSFERWAIREGYQPVEGSQANYLEECWKIGYLLTPDGRLLFVNQTDPIADNVAIPQRLLSNLFEGAAGNAPVSSWDWLYRVLIDPIPEDRRAEMIKVLPIHRYNSFHQKVINREDIDYLVALADLDYPLFPQGWEKERDAFNVLTLLRLGGEIVSHVPDTVGGRVNMRKIAWLQKIRNGLKKPLSSLPDHRRVAFENVMLRGKDPHPERATTLNACLPTLMGSPILLGTREPKPPHHSP